MMSNNNSITLPEQRISLTEQSHDSGLDSETQQQNESPGYDTSSMIYGDYNCIHVHT